MTDLPGLSYFQIDQLVNGLVADTLDVGYDPDVYNVWMSLEIRPRVEAAPGLTSLRLTALTPPRTLILTITDARIETGELKLPRANAPAGDQSLPTPQQQADQQASKGLRLLAHSDQLGIGANRLLYDFVPGDCVINGRTYRLPAFTIAAPHVDPSTYDTTNPPKVNLTTAPRVVDENPALGTGKIANVPDHARLNTSGQLVFSSVGVDLGDPITLPAGGTGGTGSSGPLGPDSITLANLVASVRATLGKADTALQSVPSNSVGTAQITDGAVILADLSDALKLSISHADTALQSIASNSIDSSKIVDGSVSAADLGTSILASLAKADTALQAILTGSVGSAQLADGGVALVDLSTSLQSAVALANSAIQSIAPGSVGSTQIADGSVSLADLTAALQATLAKADTALQGPVTGGQITDGSVALADLSDALKLSISHADTALQTIANNSIGSAQITDGTVSLADLATSLQSAVALANSALQTIAAGSIGSTQIADGGVTYADLASSVQASITLANTALQSVPVNSVGSAQIADGTVGMVDLNTALQAAIALASTAVQPAALDAKQALITPSNAGATRRALFAAALHSPVPSYWPLRPYEPSADVPTYSTTNSAVGGASATYAAMPTKFDWNSTRVTKFGYLQGAFTLAGVPTFPNVSAGRVGPTDYAHKWTPQPFYFGVLFEGTVLRFADVVAESGNRPIRVWVDGKYAGQFDMGAYAGGTTRFHTLDWGSDSRVRRVIIQFPWNVFPVSVGSPNSNVSVNALPQLPFRVYKLGDSWTQGSGTPVADGNLDNMHSLISAMTGWEVFGGGMQASAPGTPAPDNVSTVQSITWNSPQRMRAITDADPHLVLLDGTLNADGFATTTLPGFLDDLYTKIKAAAPNARIVHVGPQGYDPSLAGPSRLNNRNTCAARAAANGVTFIDPIAESWITGSGGWGAPAAGGNSSLYYGGTTGSDMDHLRDYEYYTARLLASLRNALST